MREFSGSSSEDELLKGEPSQDALFPETLPKDLSFEDLFPNETLRDDCSFELKNIFTRNLRFEDDLTRETLSQDLPSQNSSTGEDRPFEDTSFEERSVGDVPFEDTSSLEDLEIERDSKLPDIRHRIVKSLQAAMQWCDAVANEPNDIITNLKSNLSFIIVICIMILLLWTIKFIYG